MAASERSADLGPKDGAEEGTLQQLRAAGEGSAGQSLWRVTVTEPAQSA